MAAKEALPVRNIPRSFKYVGKEVKPLSKVLRGVTTALGHALSAYNTFVKIKGNRVSPDGYLGGDGYIMSIPELRNKLNQACDILSSVSDTLHDEITADHWEQPIKQLPAEAEALVEEAVEDAEAIMKQARVSEPEIYVYNYRRGK